LIGRTTVADVAEPRPSARERGRARRRRRDALALLAAVVAAGVGAALVLPAHTAPHSGAAATQPAGGGQPAADSYREARGLERSAPGAADFDWSTVSAADLRLQAQSGVVLDLDRHRVVWARDATSHRAPASLAKMMTAMIAVDAAGGTSQLDREVTVPGEATDIEPNLMGLTGGEVVTLRTLLYGVFLDSGNDAAETLARVLMPRDRFLQEMNDRARRLGLADTHFSNPTGLDEPGLFSTAYDLGVIAATLWRDYPVLVGIASTRDIVIPAEPSKHKAFEPQNFNKMLWQYPGANGLKTGFTDDAGGCVAVTVQRGSRHLVAVIMHSDVFFTDAAKALDAAGHAEQLTRSVDSGLAS
jgi:D-alanyl-D-alanine carboxypeptidase (penicillin-binding protein 5/6)